MHYPMLARKGKETDMSKRIPSSLFRAATLAADWLIDCEPGSDPHARGVALRRALARTEADADLLAKALEALRELVAAADGERRVA